MPHAFEVIEGTKLLRCVGLAGTDQRRLGEWGADEIERLRGKIKTVLETFERDEAQGYRSKDRQFAITILKD